jgi:hypothetical protein
MADSNASRQTGMLIMVYSFGETKFLKSSFEIVFKHKKKLLAISYQLTVFDLLIRFLNSLQGSQGPL